MFYYVSILCSLIQNFSSPELSREQLEAKYNELKKEFDRLTREYEIAYQEGSAAWSERSKHFSKYCEQLMIPVGQRNPETEGAMHDAAETYEAAHQKTETIKGEKRKTEAEMVKVRQEIDRRWGKREVAAARIPVDFSQS
jgi:hypothetical protein